MTVGTDRFGKRKTVQGLVALSLALAAIGCTTASDSAADGDPSSRTGTDSALRVEPGSAPTSRKVREGAYDWSQMPIGGGGFVTGIVSGGAGENPTIVARTDVGGAYLWDRDSASWDQMLTVSALGESGLTAGDYSVLSVAIAPSDPSVMYLAVGNDYNPASADDVAGGTGRVLRSADGGASWTESSQRWFVAGNQRYRTGSERLAVDPRNPDHVYFGTQREGLWVSVDGGGRWRQVPLDQIPTGVGGDPAGDQAGVSFVSTFAGGGGRPVVYAGVANRGVFASRDDGGSWESLVEIGEGVVPSSASRMGDSLVFAANSSEGERAALLAVLADSSVREIDPPADSSTWNIAVDPFDEDNVVLANEAVRDGQFWSSADGGSSWRTHSIEVSSPEIPWLEQTNLASYMTVGQLMFDQVVRGRLWFAEGMGVWTTDDLDADTVVWTSTARGIEELVVSGLVTRPGFPPLVTVADRQGFVLEDDRYPESPLVDDRFASGSGIDFSGGSPEVLAWVGAESNIALSPEREARGATSSDGGATWQEMTGLTQEMFGGEVAVSATDAGTIVWVPTYYANPYEFLTKPVGVSVSHDGGTSWERSTVDGDVHSFHRLFWWFTRRALAADRVNGNFYLMSDEERFYVSRDGARTWQLAPHTPPCTETSDCHVFGQVQAHPTQADELWASTGRGGLYRTSDAGATSWTNVPGIAEARAFAFGAPAPDSVYHTIFVLGRPMAEAPLVIMRSTDDGKSWTVISEHPYDLAIGVNALAADYDRPGRIYVGLAGGGVVVGDDPAW